MDADEEEGKWRREKGRLLDTHRAALFEVSIWQI
jgi:hypothetical protein